MAENKEKTEKIFYMKGRNAEEYFRITQKEFFDALKEIRTELVQYYLFDDSKLFINKVQEIIKKTIGGL